MVGRINIMKVAIVSKVVYTFGIVTTKVSFTFFTELERTILIF